MSEQPTGWEAPTPKPLQTAEQALAEHYADRENPDDINDMVFLKGDELVLPEASAEQDKFEKYEFLAADIIDVAKNRNSKQREILMDDFLGLVLSDAEKGDVKSSDGVAYTAEALQQRFMDFYKGITEPVDAKNAFIYLPSSEGLRIAMTAFYLEQSTSYALMKALYERLSGLDTSPEAQSKIKTEVGGVAVESAGIINPNFESAEVEDPFDSLPIDIQNEVDQYRSAVLSKKIAEGNKNFAAAADAGRRIYEVGKSLSPQAQKFTGFRR